MSANEIKIVAKFDASGVEKGAKTTQKALADVATSANKLDSSLSGQFTKSANTAGQSLTNLGRIAQDAPFGFIGIQNNINPLIESFQRLKAETGSTGSALKALAGSLMGAGGLGLAVSLATSALTILTQKGFFDSAKAAKENKDEIKSLGATYDAFYAEIVKVTEALASESAKVQLLSLGLEGANASALQRKNIIEELNKISPQYLGNLDKEKSTYDDITKAIFAYTESLAKSVEIKALLPEFEKLIQKIIKAQVELSQLRRIGTDQDNLFGLPINEFKAEEKRLEGIVKGTVNEVKVAKKALTEIAGSGLSLAEILFGSDVNKKGTKDAVDKTKKTVKDVLDDLREQIKLLNKEEILFNTDKTKERTSAFLSAIKELVLKFNLDPEGKLIKSLFDEAKVAKLGFVVKDSFLKLGIAAAKEFKDAIGAEFMKEPVPISFSVLPMEKGILGKIDFPKIELPKESFDELEALAFLRAQGVTKGIQDGLNVGISGLRLPELKELKESTLKQLQGLTNLIQSTAVNAFAGIGQAIGDAVSGGGLSTGLENVLDVMGDFLIQLGKSAIIYSKLLQGIKIASKSPISGIIAGIIAIAAGTFIKNIQLPKFATGTRSFSGGTALVGERGPELVTLPRGASVTPNAQTNAILGQQLIYIPSTVIRGQDIVTSFHRSTKSLGRTS